MPFHHIPRATYRLQLNHTFTFHDAIAIAPYLHDLGISDIYASPILKARPGSIHGYDITDHHCLNPEIGSDDDFHQWCDTLSQYGMSILLDIVPNHMSVVGNENPWWNDILENGLSSPYSSYFDIAWSDATRAELLGRVLIPILGQPYAEALESMLLQLHFEHGAFFIVYYDHRLPVAPRSYDMILGYRLEELEAQLPAQDLAFIEYQSILTAVKHLPRSSDTSPSQVAERQREKEVVKRRLSNLVKENLVIANFLHENIRRFNGALGDSSSFNMLENLLNDQVYRLAYWRVAAEEVNYRRFFDVNELAALSMERQDVFENTHTLILDLIRNNHIQGLRIDHPDGLFNPLEYFNRLQGAIAAVRGTTSPDFYIVIEKILAPNESLPKDWPIAGTTGYEFLNLVNQLFVNTHNAGAFTRLYGQWIGDDTTLDEIAYEKRKLILQIALAGEMQMLTNQLDRLAQKHRSSRDFTRNSLRIALREIIASFPVYRSYIGDEISDADRRHVLRSVRRAMLRNPTVNTSIFHYIRDTLLLRPPGSGPIDPLYMEEQRQFVGKFQQVTSPVMAKAVEDTSFYIYNRLISLNEVGGDPGFGITAADFHQAMQTRQQTHPHALSATATHDTKRGEDVRARINLLSEIPERWLSQLLFWNHLNENWQVQIEDYMVPDRNEEYFIYQTLIGTWPLVDRDHERYVQRIQDYMSKALHEAKVHSSWINPNQSYDDAIHLFIERILNPNANQLFLNDLSSFLMEIKDFAILNSLAQVALKIGCPGIPDFYQGTELWDLSLVDPDNRKPVDYSRLTSILQEDFRDPTKLVANRDHGQIKMHLIRQGLALRQRCPDLFAFGSYKPLDIEGEMRDHVIGFVRSYRENAAVFLVPRLLLTRFDSDISPFHSRIWDGARVDFTNLPNRWRDVVTDKVYVAQNGYLPLDQLFSTLPISMMELTNT